MTLKQLLGNTGWLLGERLLRMALSFLIGIWIARQLGPAIYGELAFALAVVALMGPIASLGTDRIVLTDLARPREASGGVVGTAIGVRFLAGAAAALAAALVALSLDRFAGGGQLVLLVCLMMLPFQAFDVLELFFQARMQAMRGVTARLSALAIASGGRVAGLLIGASVAFFAAMQTLEILLDAVFLFLLYRATGMDRRKWRFDRDEARSLLYRSFPLLLSGLAITVYMRIDQVLIRLMMDVASVGKYAAVARITQTTYFIPTALSASIAPLLTRTWEHDPDGYFAMLGRIVRWMVIGALCVAASIALASREIVAVLLGDAYLDAVAVVTIQAFSLIFVGFGYVSGQHLLLRNEARLFLHRTLAGALTGAALTVALIPRFGLIGAAAASLCGHIVGNIALFHDKAGRAILAEIFLATVYARRPAGAA